MKLSGKKKIETKTCCSGICTLESMAKAESAKAASGIKVLRSAVQNALLWKNLSGLP